MTATKTEERRRSSLEDTLGAYVDGANALLSMIPEELADELYSRIGKRLEDFEERLPSEKEILGMLVENAEPGENANGLEATARAIRKTSTPAVPRLGRCGGEVSMG